MNSKWMTTMLAAAGMTLFASGVSFATNGMQVEANVPFSFHAGTESFPAGRYVFTVDNPMSSAELTVQRQDGSKTEVLMTESKSTPEPANQSKLVFDEYGGNHFLAQVWVAGLDEARVLPKSEIQREYARLLEHREVPATAMLASH